MRHAVGLLSLATLSACGRIDFAELADAPASDDAEPTACTTAWFDMPGAASSSSFAARVPSGWAVVGVSRTTSDLELRIISDENIVGPPIILTSTVFNGYAAGVAFVGDALHVVWGDNGDHFFGRFAVDGSSLGTFALGVPAVGRVTSDTGQSVITTYNNAVIAQDAFDASGVSVAGPHVISATGAFPGIAAHGAGGYGVLWFSGTGPFQLHLGGIDEAGATVLADRVLDTTSNQADILWTGTQYMISWVPTGGVAPLIATVDASFAPLAGPFTPLGITTQTVPTIAWNGDELGYVRFAGSSSNADQRFTPMDLAGLATGPEVLFGDATGSQVTGAPLAGGPRRFGMLWTTGAQYQMRFGVVCR